MSRARDLSRVISSEHLTLQSNNIGIGSTNPTAKLNVAGVVSATEFYGGDVTVTGVTTIGNVVIGGGTTDLIVNGDARVTGILTIGTASITLDPSNNSVTATEIRVGTGASQSTIKSDAGQIQITDQNGVAMGVGITYTTITGPAVQAVESNHYYNINTASGIVTCTLPQTPNIGDYITFIDNSGSFGLYTCFVETHASASGAASYIHGSTSDLDADVQYATFTCTYTGFSTTGWIVK